MIKSDKVIHIAAAKSKPKCGDCLHFKHVAKFERVCSLLGLKHFAEAPKVCFKVNPHILGKKNPDVLSQIGLLMRDFTPQELRVFAYMIRENALLEKNYKLKFGQPVMFRVGGNDYLSNYFRGYVLGAATVGDGQVFVTSDMATTQRNMPAMMTLLPSSVFTLTAWKKKKAQLIKDKRLKDPNPLYSSHVEKKELTQDYTPPTLESAPTEWFDKVNGGNGRIKGKVKKAKDGTLTFSVKQ